MNTGQSNGARRGIEDAYTHRPGTEAGRSRGRPSLGVDAVAAVHIRSLVVLFMTSSHAAESDHPLSHRRERQIVGRALHLNLQHTYLGAFWRR